MIYVLLLQVCLTSTYCHVGGGGGGGLGEEQFEFSLAQGRLHLEATKCNYLHPKIIALFKYHESSTTIAFLTAIPGTHV